LLKKHARKAQRKSRAHDNGNVCSGTIHAGGVYATVVAHVPVEDDGPPILQVLTAGTLNALEAIEDLAKNTLKRWGADTKTARGRIDGTWPDGREYHLAPPAVYEAVAVLNLIREFRAVADGETERDRRMMKLGALGERLVVRQNEHLAVTGCKVLKGCAKARTVQNDSRAQRKATPYEVRVAWVALCNANPGRTLAYIDRQVGEHFNMSSRSVRRYRA